MSIIRFTYLCLVWLGMLLPLQAQTSNVAQATNSNASTTVQVPRLIRLTGTLNLPPTASGNGVVNLTFSLYKEETGGTSLWQESQNVEVDPTGHYTALLGTTQSEGLPIDLFTSGQAQWLGVRPQGEPEQPRIMLVSVPFALKAGDAETFGGKPPSAYVAAPPVAAGVSAAANATASPHASPLGSSGSQTQSNAKHPAVPVDGSGTPDYLALWTSASTLSSSAIYQSPHGYIGIGTDLPIAQLNVDNDGGNAIIGITRRATFSGITGINEAAGDVAVGVYGRTNSTSGAGVFGNAAAAGGTAYGVQGSTSTSNGAGVYGAAGSPTAEAVLGINSATSGSAYGVEASTDSSGGTAIFGFATSAIGETIGVQGTTNSTSGIGVQGTNAATKGTGYGVVGQTETPGGAGVYGTTHNPAAFGVFGGNGATTGTGFGVEGTTATPEGSGVYGATNNATANGVTGDNLATTGLSNGVYGTAASSSGNGVFGINTDTTGTGSGGAGVYGQTSSPNGFGVVGLTTVGGYGVFGQSNTDGYGVYGSSNTGVGILGVCIPTGSNICYNGVAGINTSTSGAVAALWGMTESPEGTAVYMVNSAGGDLLFGTQSDGGDATFYVQADGSGSFAGDLNVGGAITAGTKDFKIDHPLDPANKYLVHASVESSEMMNIYTGNITTDGQGLATVQLPDWFEALNRDFRYQLTVMGQFAQAIVADEVANHHFRIRTDKPNVKVSWQVTGVRQDAFAKAHPLQVEEEKAPYDRGHYLHPELYGAPQTANINHPAGSPAIKHKGPILTRPVKALPAQQRPQFTPPALPPAPQLGMLPHLPAQSDPLQAHKK